MCFDITNLNSSCSNKDMKTSCIIITIALLLAIVLLGIMVKIAADISVEEQSKEITYFGDIFKTGKPSGTLRTGVENSSFDYIAERYPYLAAIIENNKARLKPVFACFGAMVSKYWLITSAHCHATPTSNYRVLLLYDFANNFSWTHPILYWSVHWMYKVSDPDPAYDIALARVNLTEVAFKHLRFASVDRASSRSFEVSVWKTLNSKDDYQTAYLTNDFSSFPLKPTEIEKCDAAAILSNKDRGADLGLICVDLRQYSDCFVNEFGPIFIGDKIVGVLGRKPDSCEIKLAVFTNVSYHSNWIWRQIT